MLFSDRCTVTVRPEVNIPTTDRRKRDSISSFETTPETDPPPSLTFIKTIGRTRWPRRPKRSTTRPRRLSSFKKRRAIASRTDCRNRSRSFPVSEKTGRTRDRSRTDIRSTTDSNRKCGRNIRITSFQIKTECSRKWWWSIATGARRSFIEHIW